ncbi:MAG TPA: MTH1187 family thiamine-binding protein [bacterium]
MKMKQKKGNTVLAGFSIAPFGVGDKLSKYIAGVLNIVDRSGLEYRLGSMQTCVEGDFERVIKVITACHKYMIRQAPRVLTHITIDDRHGRTGRITGKIKDVERVLGRKLRHI